MITDVLFGFDILVIFNSAYYDLDMNLVDDRKMITTNYLRGWFTVDLLAIIPFDIILTNLTTNVNGIVRIARVGRLYKLVKLTRMLRILKIMKEKSKLMKYLNDILKIGHSLERLLFFVIIFFIMCHISSCLWLMIASFTNEEFKDTWVEDF